MSPGRIVAIVAAYNEERFIGGCLRHLAGHGVDTYLIDNESTDRTTEIALEWEGRGLIGIETFPRDHLFRWRPLLQRKQAVAAELGAEWVLHVDADERFIPPRPDQTLAEALRAVSSAGDNAVAFLEYSFVPTVEAPDHDHPRYEQTMQWYYRCSAGEPHIRAWRPAAGTADLATTGGHHAAFPGRQLHPTPFGKRHYLFLSVDHAVRKYVAKTYDPEEVAGGWHGARATLSADQITLVPQASLRRYDGDGTLDPGAPWPEHPLFARAVPADGGERAREPDLAPPKLTRPGPAEQTSQRGSVSDGVLGAVVLGMHRSGTSAVAGTFVACGFHAGPAAALLAPNPANPRGFFERTELTSLNDEILADAGATWFCPPRPAAGWRPRPADLERAGAALERLLAEAGAAPVVLKDPRIGTLFDLWLPLLEGRLTPVLVIRDPLEVALSLGDRDGTPLPFGLGIWELHLTELLRRLHGATVTVAPYPAFGSPGVAERVVGDVVAVLAPERRTQTDVAAAAAAFDDSLRHHGVGASPFDHAGTLSPRQLGLWRWLADLQPGAQVLRAPAELHRPSAAAWAAAEAERARRDAVQRIAVLEGQLTAHEGEIERLKALVMSEQGRLERELAVARAALSEQEERHAHEQQRLQAALRSEQQRLEAEVKAAAARTVAGPQQA